jgi:rhomboid family protein
MRNMWREMDQFLARFLTPAVRYILVANVALFVLYMLLSIWGSAVELPFILLMETPNLAVKRLCLWQFVTYMFMHATPFHLLMNMVVLWFFAPRLEHRWGTREFLRFYFIVGIGAGLGHALLALATGHGASTMLGASGAIYGVILAYALYYPNDTVLLYFIIPVKVKYLIIVIGIFTFLSTVGSATAGGGSNGISHVTHLGGLAVALVYLKGGGWFRRKPWRRRPKAKVWQVDPRTHPDFR